MASGGEAHPPKPPKVKADPKKRLHCSIQTSEKDVPILRFDIHGGVQYYNALLKVLKEREIALSPFIIKLLGYSVHVTPLAVPVPKADSKAKGKGKGMGKGKGKEVEKGKEECEEQEFRSSLHIIRLFSSKVKSYEVDLLMKDENLYYVAFRRHVLILDEKEIRRGSKLGPGNWYGFKNEVKNLPDFIHCIPINMVSDYSHPEHMKPGGCERALDDIFYQLTMFETDPVVTKEFMRVMYAIMLIYCEVRRSREMLNEMSGRMERGEEPSTLSRLLSKTIHMWRSFSSMVLTSLKQGRLSLKQVLTGIGGDVLPARFKTMEDLIGENGELLIARLRPDNLTMTDSELEVEVQKARKPGYVPNPKFTTLEVQVPQQVLEGGEGEQEEV